MLDLQVGAEQTTKYAGGETEITKTYSWALLPKTN